MSALCESPDLSACERNLRDTAESVALSISKIPITRSFKIFLLFPTCKNIFTPYFWCLVLFFYHGENFLRRKLFPAPLSKNLKRLGLIFCHYFVCSTLESAMFVQIHLHKIYTIQRSNALCTPKLSRLKVFGATFFQKGSENIWL